MKVNYWLRRLRGYDVQKLRQIYRSSTCESKYLKYNCAKRKQEFNRFDPSDTTMTTDILNALNILTKPLGESHADGAPATPQGALLAALQANRAELQEGLQGGGGLQEVMLLLQEVQGEAGWLSDSVEDPTWAFVQESLLLLLCLRRHLSRLLQDAARAAPPRAPDPRRGEPTPPLPPDALSVSQQKTLEAGLQFVVSLGLRPYLSAGVGVAAAESVEGVVRRDVAPTWERRLQITTTVLLEVSGVSALGTLLFTRHLADLMAALCQLGYQPCRPETNTSLNVKGLTADERKSCREALHGLLGKVYQPIVISELLVLQGGRRQNTAGSMGNASTGGRAINQAPPWLRRLCGQLLSDRLMQPNGVQSVVRAILEGPEGGEVDWRRCEAVAKILAARPQQSGSAQSYYSQVCPQILAMLRFQDKLTERQFQHVATRAVLNVLQVQPQFGQQYLLQPLLSPLQRCSTATVEDPSQDAVQEWELSRCVEEVYKVCVVANSPSDVLLRMLGDVVPTIFSLYCFTKQNVSNLRAPCQEILLWYLSNAELSLALSTLKRLSGLQGEVAGVAPHFQFSPGAEGGARLTYKEPISDEDDSMYERLEAEQQQGACLVQLLVEMTDSDLPGEFFLLLLQGLTHCAADQEVEEEEEGDMAAMTLLEAEQRLWGRNGGRGQRLALLQVLAMMCEGLPHTHLLRRTSQMVEFIMTLLQRVCVCLERGQQGAVESQTLRMGIGLIATVLTAQLQAEDYSCLQKLLVPLETISQQHTDHVIRELAADLRAAIGTRGAYQPNSITMATAHTLTPSAAQPNTHTHSKTHPTSKTHTSSNTHATPNTHLKTHATPNTHSGKHTCCPRTPLPQAGQPANQSTKVPKSREAPTVSEQNSAAPSGSSPKSSPGPDSGSSPKSSPGPDSGSSTKSSPGPDSGCSGLGSATPFSPSRPLAEVLLEACDPDVVTRTMALRELTCYANHRHTETRQAQEKVLTVFLENLQHEDTFVYLSAVQGLAVLADWLPEQVLPRLMEEYRGVQSPPPASRGRSVETRLKVGEALMRAIRSMGDLAPHYGRSLIGAFLVAARDDDGSMRASSLANLAELCQLLQFSLGALAHELCECVTALINTDREVQVRRAAVHVITLLLRGLSDHATQVLEEVLGQLYRALRGVVRSDPDQVLVLHAQLALEELDEIMRRFLFPKQRLEKKIRVLP